MPVSHIVFNTPPGWPRPPRGWLPPYGWEPPPEWPRPPRGWEFFHELPDEGSGTPAGAAGGASQSGVYPRGGVSKGGAASRWRSLLDSAMAGWRDRGGRGGEGSGSAEGNVFGGLAAVDRGRLWTVAGMLIFAFIGLNIYLSMASASGTSPMAAVHAACKEAVSESPEMADLGASGYQIRATSTQVGQGQATQTGRVAEPAGEGVARLGETVYTWQCEAVHETGWQSEGGDGTWRVVSVKFDRFAAADNTSPTSPRMVKDR